MNPRRRLMLKRKARAINEAVMVTATVEDTIPVLEEIASETVTPVIPRTVKKRSTRKTTTTKKK